MIHCRKAFADIIEVFSQYAGPVLKGVFHCYSAGKKGIEKVSQITTQNAEKVFQI